MRIGKFGKRLPAAAAALSVLLAAAAPALESGDIRALLRNRVAEEVIINLIQSEGTAPFISPGEADEFRSLGASERLLAALSPPAAAAAAPVVDAAVFPVAITVSDPYPALGAKEGWLSISNHDQLAYHMAINQKEKRLFVSRHPNGGVLIEPGRNLILALRKEEYKLYGDSGKALKVKIREKEATSLSFNPFGIHGNSGMTGVAMDRERTRSETLFEVFTPAPPAIIVQEPPPVIVVPGGPPWPYYPAYPAYPPPPPRHHGGGFFFNFRR